MNFTTRAAFHIKGRWVWKTWTHNTPSKHAAILDKARELDADHWDIGNALHEETDRVPGGHSAS